jgi:glycosyltransferase involved in cell wall biosynthesis
MSCGTPVIAYGRGGATETVIPPGGRREPTGLWFLEQTAECLSNTLARFETKNGDFAPGPARRQAQRFNPHRFADELFGFLGKELHPATAPARRAA